LVLRRKPFQLSLVLINLDLPRLLIIKLHLKQIPIVILRNKNQMTMILMIIKQIMKISMMNLKMTKSFNNLIMKSS